MEQKDVVEKKPGEIIGTSEGEAGEERLSAEAELAELKDRHLRLYAEFENYRKRVQREKEELIKYGNESLLHDILPVIDTLEMALQHSTESAVEGLVRGVEMTLREFQRVVEKYGLTQIAAVGKPFDPSVHHAMTQVERDDVEDKTVVEEFRKGYLLGDKVIRPSLVAVSKRPCGNSSGKEVPTDIEVPTNTESKEE